MMNCSKTVRLLFTTISAATLASCASMMGSAGVDWENQDPGPLPEHESAKEQAISVIKGRLKDPDSAQFKDWTPFFKTLYNYGIGAAGNYEPLWAICAQVNAKNSFGGYTGYEWWYVKFRDGEAVRHHLGTNQGSYDCIHGPDDPSRRASDYVQ